MIHDVERFLREHYPFSTLPESSLGALSFHIIVRYYSRDEVIFTENSKPLEYLYIIRKGAVSLELNGQEIDFLHEVNVVPSLKGDSSVLDAAKVMRDKNLSCVFVEDAQKGIVTERDIIKRVVAEGKDPSKTALSEIMSYPVISVDEESFLFEAIIEMANKNIRRLGVSREGRLVGVIEDKDIIAHESKNLVVLIKEIEKAHSVEDLR